MVQEEVIAGAVDIGQIFRQAAADIKWNQRVLSFVDNNAKCVICSYDHCTPFQHRADGVSHQQH